MLAICIIWFLAFVCSRIHLLNSKYTNLRKQRDNEAWLHMRCQEDEFYHNMRKHSKLCDDIELRSESWLLLDAMYEVLQQTYLCGYDPCIVLVEQVLNWLLGHGLPFTILATILLLFTPTCLVSVLRNSLNLLADHRMHNLYNAPYGVENYHKTIKIH